MMLSIKRTGFCALSASVLSITYWKHLQSTAEYGTLLWLDFAFDLVHLLHVSHRYIIELEFDPSKSFGWQLEPF